MRLDGSEQGLDLRTLLDGLSSDDLCDALRVLLGSTVRITDQEGALVMGTGATTQGCTRAPLTAIMSPLGYIESDACPEGIAAAAVLIEAMLECSLRYFIATEFHTESVLSDYEQLQREHQALEASEARYRALSEHLENRVQEQIGTIARTQRRLYQAEKMASLGRLGAGMAHEINNPIGFIKSNLEVAKTYVEQFASFYKHVHTACGQTTSESSWRSFGIDSVLDDFDGLLDESIEGSVRIATIVARLKQFSNADGAEEQIVDVNDILRSACEVLVTQVPPQTKIRLIAGPLSKMKCRPRELGLAFMNLMLNGAQALQGGAGELIVHTQLENDEIIVQVADTGVGIAETDLPRIFDPFFTTRDVGGGAGLGLTAARDVFQSHGGSIEASSQIGTGSTFVIRLPTRK